MKYIAFSYYLKFGPIWIRIWGRKFKEHEMAIKVPNGFHRISYLPHLSSAKQSGPAQA